MRTIALGGIAGEVIFMPEKKSVKKSVARPSLKANAKTTAKSKTVNVKANKKPAVKVTAKPATKSPIKAKPAVVKAKKTAVVVSKSAQKQKTGASVKAPVKKITVKAKTVKDVQPIKKPEKQVTQSMLTEIKSKPKMTATKTIQTPAQLEPKKVAETVTTTKGKTTKTQNKAHLSTMGVPPYKESKNEEYMNANQREHFSKILHLWKKELMEEVDRTVHHMQDDAANFPDPNDRATQEEEFSLELRTRDRERKLIKKIEEALQNIENDDYGYCEVCGIEIGIRRLEARPTANLCIDCKTLDEIRERTHS